jgi:hypothetical protein
MAAATEQAEPQAAAVPAKPERIWLTRPGLYEIPEADYHRDPVPGGSLSCSVAKKLIDECPAIVKHEMDHARAPKKAWDLGGVFHSLVLGRGSDFVIVEREDGKPEWNTDKVKAEVAAVRAAGKIPLKRAELAAAERMAAAVFADPNAGPLFTPGTGLAERTIVWTHERTGTPMRSMLDWLRLDDGMPPLIGDLKSARSVSKRGVAKAVAEFLYYMQDPFYRAAVASLGFDLSDIGFIFVFVDSSPPHLVTTAVLDAEAVTEGMACIEEAIDLWVRCHETGIWPGYTDDILTVSLPNWRLKH